MTSSPLLDAAIARFDAVSLADLDRRAGLQRRVDRKYVIPLSLVRPLLAELEDGFGVLAIDGRRGFEYRTTYFDTASLLTYRAHVQRRRRRFKCRSRHYVASGLHMFEVKLKGARGETLKERLATPPESHGVLDAETRSFLSERLLAHYGLDVADELAPTLRSSFRRVTFADLARGERLTLDLDLRFERTEGAAVALAPEYAILESKALRAPGAADRALRALGARPTGCSKYCLGVALTRPEVRGNDFLRLARRHFQMERPALGSAAL